MQDEARSTIWSVTVTFEAFTEEEAVERREHLKGLLAAGFPPAAAISDLAVVMPLVTDDDLTPPDLSDSLE